MKWPPTLPYATKYLGLPEVSKALNIIPARVWEECNKAGEPIASDLTEPSYLLLPELLKTITLHMFLGDKDIVCNWMGLADMAEKLTWNGQTGFNVLQFAYVLFKDQTKLDWHTSGELAGYYRESRGLSLILMYNASHMASLDNPRAALDLFNRFIGINSPYSTLTPVRFSLIY